MASWEAWNKTDRLTSTYHRFISTRRVSIVIIDRTWSANVFIYSFVTYFFLIIHLLVSFTDSRLLHFVLAATWNEAERRHTHYSLVTSTYLHSHRGAQTGEHVFFFFLYRLSKISFDSISSWNGYSTRMLTIISSTGEYPRSWWKRERHTWGGETRVVFPPFRSISDLGENIPKIKIVAFYSFAKVNRRRKKK